MKKVAAIDIGTNSTRFMVVSQGRNGLVRVVEQGGEITRLGESLYDSGKLKPIAQTRTLKAIKQTLRKIKQQNVQAIELFATSAVREAKNGKSFANKVKKETGLPVNILSGQTEAKRAYEGITASLPYQIKNPITLDIGGGSTEIVYQDSKQKLKKVSFKLGAVRLHEMTLKDREKGRNYCKKAIQKNCSKRMFKGKNFIGAGGTLTTLSAMHQKLKVYNHKKIHNSKLTTKQIETLFHKIHYLSLAERKKIPGLPPKRADIIIAGTAILLMLLQQTGAKQIRVSDRGILYGSCLNLFKKSK